jgi:GntR family transcriptional regulator, rspAB operon transcriptional repressor
MPRTASQPQKLREREPSKTAELSLADRAYKSIRDSILQGTLAMGDVLSRRKLAGKLNMSFLPITEALQRLESEGLVESRSRIGTRVRIPSRQDILDRYILREALEVQSARLCCEQMTSAKRVQFLRSARHLDSLFKASAVEEEDSSFLFSVRTYHLEFHTRIAAMANSPGLLKAIEKEQVLIFNWLFDTAAHRKSLPANFHLELAKAISSGEISKADEAMRKHVRHGLDETLSILGTLEVSDSWRSKRTS